MSQHFSLPGPSDRQSTRGRQLAGLALIGILALIAACGGSEMSEYEPSLVESGAPMAMSAGEADESSAGAGAMDGQDTASAIETGAGSGTRRLIFTGEMRARYLDTAAAIDDLTAWAEAEGGYVESIGVTDTDSGPEGRLVLRVPSESFDAARQHVRDLADEVDSDQKQRQDVTAQYADLDARLTNLESAERELRELLEQSRERGGSTEDVLSVHREVTRVRGEIDGLRAQRDTLADQVALSTLQVWLVPVAPAATAIGAAWRPGTTARRALADLASGARHLGDLVIYLTIAIVPLFAALGVAAWLAWRLFRRVRPRRRATETPPQSAPGAPAKEA